MTPPDRKSLLFKLGALVVVIESAALLSIGLYYGGRFSGEIDANLRNQALIAGSLMGSQLLRYESIADAKVMAGLLGDEFVEGLVVGGDGKIYYASNPALVGRIVGDVPGLDPAWFSSSERLPRVISRHEGDRSFLIGLTPVVAFEGGAPFFHVYVKIGTRASQAKKTAVAVFFILGSAVCVLFTSAALIGLAAVLVTRPLRRLKEGADRLARGELDTALALPRQDEIGSLARSLEAMRDALRSRIVQLRDANLDLKESGARLRAFVNALPDAVFMLDSEGRYLEALTADTSQLAAYPEKLRGKRFHDVFAPELADAFLGVVRRAVISGETQTLEYRLDIEGRERWFEGRASRIGDDLAGIGRAAWVAREITARKGMEASLRQAKEEAERANDRLIELDRMKSAFLSSVSHELRTPLTSLLGFAKLLIKNFKRHFEPLAANDPDLARQGARIVADLRIIEHEGERLTRLINDVLDLSKIESGRMEWHDREIAPAEVIGRAAEAVSGLFLDRPEVELRADVPDDLPPVRVDPDRLQQVVINLLSNAAKFTDAGHVAVKASATGGFLQVAVKDTGSGVAPEDLPHVFETFYQARRGDTRLDRPEGTGLGLAICRQIVVRYGGDIWVESAPGKGSAFLFRLPLVSRIRDGS